MKLLDLEYEQPEKYKWGRGVSGIWHHWEMSVLDGNVVLHIEGLKEEGFRGAIQLNNEFNPDRESIYTTLGVGYKPFDTPDKCAEILEHQWREIINTEARLMLT